MKHYILCLIFLLTLSACTTPQYNYVPTTTQISEPPINQIVQVSVGEHMVRQGAFVETDAIQVLEAFDVGAISGYKFTPGYYLKVGEDKKSTVHIPEAPTSGGKVSTWGLPDPYQSMQVMKDTNKICGVSAFGGKACESQVKFIWLKRPSVQANGFQQSLIYSGKIGNKINISYREFSNNSARPAFNNDVEYDLTESSPIAYKGAEIQIIEATNRYIKYKVIRNFNTP